MGQAQLCKQNPLTYSRKGKNILFYIQEVNQVGLSYQEYVSANPYYLKNDKQEQ